MVTSTASAACSDPLIGRTLAGKFRLEERLRAGAMGAIYRAHHLSLDKAVCIKIMLPELAKDSKFALRFHREARAASRFNHPSSILILDYGEDDGLLFIAMELVEGRDLSDLIDDALRTSGGVPHAFPPRRIVDILTQTLAALAAAHEVGILHRDLKPENIMVSPAYEDDGDLRERVKVCDFGIAHIDELPTAADAGRRLTMKGFLLGTPEYMSPEQARAEQVDARSEVYSAGVVLYFLLTGRLPFEDESAIAVAIMQIHETPRPPSALVPNVHRGLERVCLRAMQKDPKDRYATAREMRSALREAIGDASSARLPAALVLATDTQPLPVAKKSARTSLTAVVASLPPLKSRRAVGASAGVFAAAMLAFVLAAVSSSRAPITNVTATLVGAPDTPVVAPVALKLALPPAPGPAYAMDSARIDLGAAVVSGATAASVERAITPVKSRLDACYRAALPRIAGPVDGAATLHLETDDSGVIRRASVRGALQSEVSACIANVVVGRKVPNVDTGHASADVPLTYRPR